MPAHVLPDHLTGGEEEKGGGAKLFCGEETFLKKGSLPHTPFSKNFHRNCFYYK